MRKRRDEKKKRKKEEEELVNCISCPNDGVILDIE